MLTPGGEAHGKQPYFTDEEFETTAEESLGAQELLPMSPSPIRIDRFIEKHFGVTHEYQPLPHGLLGLTQFTVDGEVNAVIVAKQLSEEGSRVAERRINTTLAHEAGHGLLHASLFVRDSFPRDLFHGSDDVEPSRVLCREEAVAGSPGGGYGGEWWELQANRLMGALLLPKKLVASCLEDLFVPRGVLGPALLPQAARNQARRRLADTFDVNPIVATLRIEHLYPPADLQQLTL